MINRKRLLNTLIDLLNINSPAKNERKAADYLIRYFKRIGYSVYEDNAGNKIGGNTGNLYLRIDGEKKEQSIAFLAHMDTVSPTDGLEPIVSDEKIKSNGKTVLGGDDYAGVAVLCELAAYIKQSKIKHCPIEIIFTIAEEIGLFGIKNINYNIIKSKYAVVLDAGGSVGNIITRAPSLARFEVSINGTPAHAGSKPEKGVNAIAIAADAINNIKQGRIDHETTLNIGKITGGEATNIVPEKVFVEGETRSFNNKKIKTQICKARGKFINASKKFGGKIEFNHTMSFKSFHIPENNFILQQTVNAAKKIKMRYNITSTGGGSDANILNSQGISSIVLGVGYYEEHTKKEYILLKDLYKSFDWMLELVRR